MGIMLDTSLGIYYKGKNKLSIVSLKVIMMIGTQEDNPHKENSYMMLIRSTT